MGELKSETLLSWEGTPFILGAVENPEGLCMIVAESIDRTEYVEDTGYIVKYNIASKNIQREDCPACRMTCMFVIVACSLQGHT